MVEIQKASGELLDAKTGAAKVEGSIYFHGAYADSKAGAVG
jgi:hypothetical protein